MVIYKKGKAIPVTGRVDKQFLITIIRFINYELEISDCGLFQERFLGNHQTICCHLPVTSPM
jgi:hypothetical protein